MFFSVFLQWWQLYPCKVRRHLWLLILNFTHALDLWPCPTLPSGNNTWFQAHEVIHAFYNEPAQNDMQGQRGRRCVLLVISAGKWGRILWTLDPGVWGSLWVIQDHKRAITQDEMKRERMCWDHSGSPFQWIRSQYWH